MWMANYSWKPYQIDVVAASGELNCPSMIILENITA